jgi:hypothetical protein
VGCQAWHRQIRPLRPARPAHAESVRARRSSCGLIRRSTPAR